MTALLNRIHARIGDLWWYSAMIFVTCRIGDVINAFIGLWLVPKYVGPEELGAVLPLQQLTSFLTVPLGVVAIVFAKYVNAYAAHGEYGKVKGFIRDVLGISAVLFVLCIGGAYLIMPFFYERLRIESGLLTILILASGFVGAIGQLVGSTQQGLKRFKTMSLMNFVSAPVRLITMFVAMPIRALSGYILGQTTPGIVTTTLSAYDTHRTLKSYIPDHSWRKDWKNILNYTWPIAINTTIGILLSTLVTTVYRQRLPEIESGAHYMLSRFSELATYLGGSIAVVLFPMASEAFEKKQENFKILTQTLRVEAAIFLPLSVILLLAVPYLFETISTWQAYSAYANLIFIYTLTSGCCVILSTITSYETACKRFTTTYIGLFFGLTWAIYLICFTGCDYFNGILPASIVSWMRSVHLANLSRITYYNFAYLIVQIACFSIYFAWRRKRQNTLSRR